jgi:hypothetical protein
MNSELPFSEHIIRAIERDLYRIINILENGNRSNHFDANDESRRYAKYFRREYEKSVSKADKAKLLIELSQEYEEAFDEVRIYIYDKDWELNYIGRDLKCALLTEEAEQEKDKRIDQLIEKMDKIEKYMIALFDKVNTLAEPVDRMIKAEEDKKESLDS